MRKIISFVHISLDGFVAGPHGEMDWITINEELFDIVGKRISKTDGALYGRVTYDLMEGYWPTAADQPNASKHDKEHAAWYSKAHKFVISKSMQGAQLANTTIISDNISERLNDIKNGVGSEILLFGSPTTTHTLIQENLIDGFWLFVNPIIIGKGIPLFTDVQNKIKLKLLNTAELNCGVTEMNYSVEW